jgi:hypothetical protein
MGFLFDSYGYEIAFLFSGIMAFIGLLMIGILRKSERKNKLYYPSKKSELI